MEAVGVMLYALTTVIAAIRLPSSVLNLAPVKDLAAEAPRFLAALVTKVASCLIFAATILRINATFRTAMVSAAHLCIMMAATHFATAMKFATYLNMTIAASISTRATAHPVSLEKKLPISKLP